MVKLNLPEQMKAEFQVMIPMFIGDGQQQASRIYPQSVKGVLRFWWRALMWHECRADAQDNPSALRQLHAWESALFGNLPDATSAETPAAFSLKVTSQEVPRPQRETNWPEHGNTPSGYLGMGIWATNDTPHREGLPQLGKAYPLTLTLTLSPTMTQAQKAQLRETLQLLGMLGGLGSRSRRGFGSLQLTQLDGEKYPAFADQAAYEQAVHGVLKRAKEAPLAPYTALNKDAEFKAVAGFNSAKEAHEALGSAYKDYRGAPSQLRGAQKKVFGLPLQGEDEKARRASPLLFHIFRLADGDYGYSVVHLPADPFHNEPRHQSVNYALTAGFLKQIQEG